MSPPLARLVALAVAASACVPDAWRPPVDACVGPRCGAVDAAADAAADARDDLPADAPPPSCGGRPPRALVLGYDAPGCVIRCDGSVWCWGSNAHGQVGDGTRTMRPAPVQVRGLGGAATALAAGYDHVCAVVSGALWCWGRNEQGQLGDGTREDRATPVLVAGFERPVVGVSCGGTHSCAHLDDGTVWCWGENRFGELGDGTQVPRTRPRPARGLRARVVGLASGQYHVCARLEDGAVQCWGMNMFGGLGDGTTTQRAAPHEVALPDAATALSTLANHVCALLAGGELWCWGYNAEGAVARTLSMAQRPVVVSGLGGAAVAAAAGGVHTCAVVERRGLLCWGGNAAGQLGDGTTAQRLTPTPVVGLEGTAVRVAAGHTRTCAALTDGRVRCWGIGDEGQLGDGRATDSRVPVTVRLPP